MNLIRTSNYEENKEVSSGVLGSGAVSGNRREQQQSIDC